ncbi:MAG: hypothetical protein KatS3mg005_0371 [Bryobacteraceae bacterium]|nr:MAG: hypothetical protein KatS3mg005_0371 [Bryobacteraceae bacterium]
MAAQSPVTPSPPPPADEIRAELARILESAAFRTSKRCQEFLTFVVQHTLEGKTDRLKERSIGVELFGRDASYDTHEDPIVRVKANEVRKRLAMYYKEEGAAAPFRIELPPGGYVAAILPLETQPAPAAVPGRHLPAGLFSMKTVASAAAVLIATAALSFWFLRGFSLAGEVERFWAPVLRHPKPISIVLGESNLYQLSRRVQDRFLQKHPEYLTNLMPYHLVPTPDLDIRAEDVIPVPNLNVSAADAIAIAQLAVLFHEHRRPYRLVFGATLTQPDSLENIPAVLIGAFSNAANIQITRDLRFSYRRETTPAGAAWLIADRETGKTWRLVGVFPKQNTDTDYALVTRLIAADGGRAIIAFGGITQFGTQAAVESITNPAVLKELNFHLGRDWHRANLQFILETRVAGRTPVSPRIVMAHRW